MIDRKSTHIFALSMKNLWPLVADLKQVGQWNPKLSIEGQAAFNAEIRVVFKEFVTTTRKAEGPGRIVMFDPPHAVGWRIGIPFLLRIDETFFLSSDISGTRATHEVVCSGPVALIARPWLARYIEEYLKAGDEGLVTYAHKVGIQRVAVDDRNLPDKSGRRRRSKR